MESINDIENELDLFKNDLFDGMEEDEYEDFNEYMMYAEEDDDELPFGAERNDNTDEENLDIIEQQKKRLAEKEKRNGITEEVIKGWSDILYPEKKTYRSVLLEYFPVELCIEIDRITRTYSVDNNTKQKKICELLDEYKVPYSHLGSGTNRYGIMIDEYCIKIAYDKDGKIDNKREFIYSLALQPYVVKTYEVSETGLFSVCEYVQSFELSDFTKTSNVKEMRRILKDIASQFMIGDVGLTTKNYANWGFRDNGEIVILDYAYIYSVSFKQFVCSCDNNSILYYDKDFVNLICPRCGKKYSFSQLRKKISRKDQDEEIGNVMEKGYVLHEPEEELPFNHKFVIDATDTIMKKILKEQKKEEKSLQRKKKEPQDWDSDDELKSFDEILGSINEKERIENNG